MTYLLDTCVVSELLKTRPDRNVVLWLEGQSEASLFLSQVNVSELSKGVVKLQAQDPPRAVRLSQWLDRVQLRFEGRTLLTDAAVWRMWADLCGVADRAGQTIAPMDALIMATAQCHGLTLVTRNVQDFVRYPKVLNPWDA